MFYSHPNHYGHPYDSMYRQITMGEAINIALQQVPGQVVKAELEQEYQRMVYEVEILTRQGKFEVYVDANSGEILHIELD